MELVSIITPLYNAKNFIEQTAESIFSQTYQNWEWIVVDDASVDGSFEIVKNLAQKDSRIKLFTNEKNLRAAMTRNRGILEANGRYIAFIDSDDLWHPEKLQKQVNFMKKTGALLSYHAYQKIWSDSKNVGTTINVPEKVSYPELLKTNSIACLSAMYDVSVIGKFFMPDGFKAKEDYMCWLNILKKIDFAYGINESLGYYRILSNSYSSNKYEVALLQWRVYREYEKLKLPSCLLNFCFYSLNGYLKSKIV